MEGATGSCPWDFPVTGGARKAKKQRPMRTERNAKTGTGNTPNSQGSSPPALQERARIAWRAAMGLLVAAGLLCLPRAVLSASISCGQTIATNTTSPSQVDQYIFFGSAGQVISVSLWSALGYSYGHPMVADIYNSSGFLATATANDQANPGSSGRAVNLTLTNSDIYTVLVHDSGSVYTSSYALSLQTVNNGGCVSTPITCGQTLTANTSFRSEMDAYTFSGSAGQVISVSLWSALGYSYGCPIVADIYDPSGQLLASAAANYQSNTGAGGGAVNLTLANSGTYTVLVHDSAYIYTSSYALSLQSVTGGGCNSTPITCGQTINGQINLYSEMNSYELVASAGEHVLLSASGFAGMVADFYDPAGMIITNLSPSGTANLTLAATGVYTLLVHAGNYVGTGTYGLSLTVFGGCAPLSLGSSVVRTQQVVCLPLEIVSSIPAVWVSFTIQAPTNILNNAYISVNPPFTNASIVAGPNSQWFVNMQTSPSGGVTGDQIIGDVCFTAVSTHSAFVPVTLNNLVITNQGGSVPGGTAFGGRVVVIADQPLLEAGLSTNKHRLLTIYGNANTDYEIDYSAKLSGSPSWIPGWTNTVPASLWYSQYLQGSFSNAPVLFLRAKQR